MGDVCYSERRGYSSRHLQWIYPASVVPRLQESLDCLEVRVGSGKSSLKIMQ